MRKGFILHLPVRVPVLLPHCSILAMIYKTFGEKLWRIVVVFNGYSHKIVSEKFTTEPFLDF